MLLSKIIDSHWWLGGGYSSSNWYKRYSCCCIKTFYFVFDKWIQLQNKMALKTTITLKLNETGFNLCLSENKRVIVSNAVIDLGIFPHERCCKRRNAVIKSCAGAKYNSFFIGYTNAKKRNASPDKRTWHVGNGGSGPGLWMPSYSTLLPFQHRVLQSIGVWTQA